MLPSPREFAFPHRRIQSPHIQDPTLVSFPPSRPSLVSLDLSSPPNKSALPLTPPLTPASTRPADSDTATRSSRSNSIDISAFDPYPVSQWSPSETSCSSSFNQGTANITSEPALLPSPTSPTHPNASPITRARELVPELDTQPATRFLLVSGVPTAATSQSLRQAFVACGDLKGIFVRFQAEHGVIILAFYDVRHTIRAHRQINARIFFDNIRLASRFVSADDLRQLIGQSNFVNSNDGDLFISTSFVGPEGDLDAAALQNVLASFGDLRSFGVMDTHARAFHVEYFDARDATSALTALDGRVILGVRLHLAPRDLENTADDYEAAPAPEPPSTNSVPFPHKPSPPTPLRRLSVDYPAAPARIRHTSLTPSPPPTHTRRVSNIYKFDAVGKTPPAPRTPPRPRSISVASETESPVAGRLALPPYLGPLPLPLPVEGQWPGQQMAYLDLGEPELAVEEREVEREREREHVPYAPAQFFMGPVAQPPPPSPPPPPPPSLSLSVTRMRGARGAGVEGVVDMPPERNKIDIARIERGDDTRTTVMIKNIPNKMSDRHLTDFINDVCPRKIDFLYLRMDFTNGCNVGYAFVNFIHVENLLHFAKTKLGTKWNLFSSEKILGMSYANYQGKEALIDKFRSSSIMDQRESWRPKVFHSSGPKQGLPEEFPGPTHLRRKERSGFLPSELHPHSHPHAHQSRALFHHPPGGLRHG